MRAGAALAAATLAALLLAAPGTAADANIDKVVVSRGFDGVIQFWIEFAEPITLDDGTTVQVAIDADRNPETGNDGIDYALDWTGSASLLSAVDGEEVESRPDSLGFEHDGDVVTLSIAAEDIGSADRFDFYAFVKQHGHTDIAPVHVLFSATWTYPRSEVAAGEEYPAETYEDVVDGSLSEGDWDLLVYVIGGVFALGAVVAVVGWSVERYRKRKHAAA